MAGSSMVWYCMVGKGTVNHIGCIVKDRMWRRTVLCRRKKNPGDETHAGEQNILTLVTLDFHFTFIFNFYSAIAMRLGTVL